VETWTLMRPEGRVVLQPRSPEHLGRLLRLWTALPEDVCSGVGERVWGETRVLLWPKLGVALLPGTWEL
jgi:hypothetical protein